MNHTFGRLGIRSYLFCGVRFFLLGLILSGLALFNYSHAETNSDLKFVTSSQQILWKAHGDNSPREWDIRTNYESANAWFSILSKDDNNQPISQHLYLAIPGFEDSTWIGRTASDGMVFEAVSSDESLLAKKSLTPSNDDFRFKLAIEITSRSEKTILLDDAIFLGIGPGLGEHPIDGLGIAETLYSFVQPIALIDGELARFVDDDVNPEWVFVDDAVEWGGLHSRYFALIINPSNFEHHQFIYKTAHQDHGLHYPSRYFPESGYRIDIGSLEPGETKRLDYSVFAGPKSRLALQSDTASYTELLFPGLWQWMRGLSFSLLWILEAIHMIVPSWGLAIILLAVFVRILMYPVAKRALMSQVAFADVQKKIQPEMARIKREYRGGEQSERILELYKSHGVSPLAGLKPLLIVAIQIPIFVALFHVLGQAFELRDAGFLWIDTLAEPDRLFSLGVDLPVIGSYFNLLPFLMAFTTLLTIKLSPAPAADEASQRRSSFLQVLMAIGFLLLFYPFPAGMVLYWTMANVLHLLQQFIVEHYKHQ